jgi:hypothetical protein
MLPCAGVKMSGHDTASHTGDAASQCPSAPHARVADVGAPEDASVAAFSEKASEYPSEHENAARLPKVLRGTVASFEKLSVP